MLLRKVKHAKSPLLVCGIAIIIFSLAVYLIFLGASTWNKYYFNPPVMNSSQLDMNSKLEAKGLPDLNQITAWAGLFPALILGLFMIFVGISLLRKKNWARWITLVFSLFVGLISLLITFGNWKNLLYAAIGLAIGIYLLASRKVKSVFILDKKQRKTKKELRGLGGWLILIQIIFISNVLSYLLHTILMFASPAYNKYPEILVLILYILLIVAFALNSLVILLMYKKKESFLFYAMIFLYYDIVINFLFYNLFFSIVNLVQMGAIIYYLKKSKRVKNTFINR